MNGERSAELEEERRHLLGSLRDLDAEWAAGDVDDDDYATLRDGYTKRAADVLREIDAGRRDGPAPVRRPWGRRAFVVGVVVAVAALAGWLVARSAGERTAGRELTGADPRTDQAIALSEARQLMGTDPVAALERFDDVLAADPDQPEALTYHGWLLYVTGVQSGLADIEQQTTDDAERDLERAAAADPTYADPHCFLAVLAANARDDVARAQAEIDTCLALDPPAQTRALIESFAADLDAPSTATT